MDAEKRFRLLLVADADQLAIIDKVLEGHRDEASPPSDRTLLTATQTAQELGVSRATVWRMVADGRLPTVEIRAGRRRIPSVAVTNLATGKKVAQ